MVHLHAVEDVAVLEDLEGLVGADVVGLDYSVPVPHHHLVVVHLQTPHRVVAICREPPPKESRLLLHSRGPLRSCIPGWLAGWLGGGEKSQVLQMHGRSHLPRTRTASRDRMSHWIAVLSDDLTHLADRKQLIRTLKKDSKNKKKKNACRRWGAEVVWVFFVPGPQGVVGEVDASHPRLVAVKGVQLAFAVVVPQPHSAILGGRHQPLIVELQRAQARLVAP